MTHQQNGSTSLRVNKEKTGGRKNLATIVQGDDDYEGEAASSFPPIRPFNRKPNADDDEIEPELDNKVLNMKRGKFPHADYRDSFKIVSPLMSAETAYMITLKKNIPRFSHALSWLNDRITKRSTQGFHVSFPLNEVENLKNHTHEEYEAFINTVGYLGYRITRTAKSSTEKYTPETIVTVIWLPKD